MPYAVIADINANLKDITFSGSTDPTQTEVETWITDYSNLIDAKISNRYTVPVTGNADAEALLKRICVWFVLSEIKQVLSLGGGDKQTSQYQIANGLYERAMKLLDEIRDGLTNLPGTSSASGGPASSSYNQRNAVDAVFQKDVKQW